MKIMHYFLHHILKVMSLKYQLINIDYISRIEIHNDKYGHGICVLEPSGVLSRCVL